MLTGHWESDKDGLDRPVKDAALPDSLSQVGLDAIQGRPADADGAPEQVESDDAGPTPGVVPGDAHIVGDPDVAADYWRFQEGDHSAAIAAQEEIIRKCTGQDVTEQGLSDQAEKHGWLSKLGTQPQHLGKLLELHGFEVRQQPDASLLDLRDALAAKHAVLANVNIGRLWQGDGGLPEPRSIWVTGADVDERGQMSGIFVNDPGMSDDGGSRIPIEHFSQAWRDHGNFMVIARLLGAQAGPLREVRDGVKH